MYRLKNISIFMKQIYIGSQRRKKSISSMYRYINSYYITHRQDGVHKDIDLGFSPRSKACASMASLSKPHNNSV